MTSNDPAEAGKHAAERTPEEAAADLANAKPATDKQQEQVDGAGNAVAAPDHTAGTDVGMALQGVGPAPTEARVPGDAPVASSVNADLLGGNIVRAGDQVVGSVSASAFNVHQAFKLTPKTEWTKALHEVILAFQKELGALESGHLTRDQCRRLGLVYQA